MKKILCLLMACCIFLAGCGGSRVSVPDTNGDGKLTCTLEVRCDTLLSHLGELAEGKAALVPENGILLETVTVEFEGGETAFDVFRRVLRQEKLHFEYVDASAYNSVYIEGIGNLYEFDCGPQSGWMYFVNDTSLSIGCSAYTLADGDAVSFRYTCDLGADLGEDDFNAP